MNVRRIFVPFGVVALLGFGAFGAVTLATAQTGGQSGGQAQADSEGLLQYEQNTVDVVQRVGPSVVAVNVTAQGQPLTSQDSPFGDIPEDQIPPQLRDFFRQFQDQQQQQPREQQGSGSGFVIDDAGRLITNYHVVRAALQEGSVDLTEGSEITVTFPSNDEEYPVRVVGVNTLYDLALLELQDPANLPPDAASIPVSDSDSLEVGQKTIAIGNPFGLDFSVTTGVVSGVSRNSPGVGNVNIPYVQTDAAINPGNSGGPLLNSDGELIGVNTSILSGGGGFVGTPGNIGIGFAVPSNLLQENLAQLESGGFVDLDSRARLGVQIADISNLPEQVRNNLNLPGEGVIVQSVQPGSAAAQAGIQGSDTAGFEVMVNGQPFAVGGDVITAVNGTSVEDAAELQNLVLSQQAGDTVTLTISRGRSRAASGCDARGCAAESRWRNGPGVMVTKG